ncbi:Caspase-8 [Chionoecetes opilio]|uniref:Caspase-8 n=1 Tax=Chionoecetes opilio TaxID=41210 RepID=A0A8J4YEN2_CHIOP|nr:Caspase-8 [Chionoecetes opilio]
MLFLSVNPTTVEEVTLEIASTPTYTDGGAMGLGFISSTEVSSEGGSDSVSRLLLKLEWLDVITRRPHVCSISHTNTALRQAALSNQSIFPVRRELQLRLLKLSSLELHYGDSLSTLESNFSDELDHLSSNEEDVLEFTEIFERLKHPVPQEIKDRFDRIVASKKIPIRKPEGSNTKTFFVYAENKIMMKVCNALSPLEVHQMYTILCETKAVEEDNAMQDFLSQPCLSLDALQKVAGLKDVAFYYLVLTLMRKKMINRLYTHKLAFLLEQLKQIHIRDDKDHIHIDRALSILCRYPIASQPPGLCLIFLMTESRPGAKKDLTRVKELFEKVFKYDVFVKIDPTAEHIKSIISKLRAARNKFYDSLVVWFMGHGSKSYLIVKEGQIHRRLDLIEPFTEIEWFYKKPKLFFIQACAVKENRKRFSSSSGADMKALNTQIDSVGWKAPAGRVWQEKYADYTDVSNINCFADTLISYATMWYQPASRGEEGSLYVDTLVDQLREHGSHESIENVLRRVHYNVNTVSLLQDVPGYGEVQWKQAPYFESSLQKEFIFPKSANA